MPCDPAWPASSQNLKLGTLVETIRNKGTWASKRPELEALGFEFRTTSDARWSDVIYPALLAYRRMYGDLLVPQDFVIPTLSSPPHVWPEPARGMCSCLLMQHISLHVRTALGWVVWSITICCCGRTLTVDLLPSPPAGLHLGSIVMSIRSLGAWGNKKKELEAIHFTFGSVSDARWAQELLPAMVVYKRLHGNLLVPRQVTRHTQRHASDA